MGDCGLTGRKIVVDTYGAWPDTVAAASRARIRPKWIGQLPTMARYVAKNVVAAGVGAACLVQLAYVIGVADPVSVMIDTYGAGCG